MIQQDAVQAWNSSTHNGQGEPLEMDASAYKIHGGRYGAFLILSATTLEKLTVDLDFLTLSRPFWAVNLLTVMNVSNLSKTIVES